MRAALLASAAVSRSPPAEKKNSRGALHRPPPLYLNRIALARGSIFLQKGPHTRSIFKMSKPFDPEQAENLEDVGCRCCLVILNRGSLTKAADGEAVCSER